MSETQQPSARTHQRLVCANEALGFTPPDCVDVLSHVLAKDAVRNRYLCAWLMHADGPEGSGVGLAQLGVCFGRHHTTFIKAFRRMRPWPGPEGSSIRRLADLYERACGVAGPTVLEAEDWLPRTQGARAELYAELENGAGRRRATA